MALVMIPNNRRRHITISPPAVSDRSAITIHFPCRAGGKPLSNCSSGCGTGRASALNVSSSCEIWRSASSSFQTTGKSSSISSASSRVCLRLPNSEKHGSRIS